MNAEIAQSSAEAEIRDLMESWLKSVRAMDVNAIVTHYAADIVAYDAVAQLQFKGVDAYKKHWETCLAMSPPGTMIFEIRDLNIGASGDVAFGHCLNRCGIKEENGEEKTSWMRMTTCYRKKNGKWAIVHEHTSAPFDMQSGKTLFDLMP
jgi:uncharacterized protein (TIGR02246 family)